MTLKQTLQTDLTVALKARDELTVSTIRSVLGAVQSAEKGGKTPREFDDAAVLQVIRQQAKQRVESAAFYVTGNRPEQEARELAEAAVLEKYIPTQLSDEALETLVISVVRRFENVTPQQFGLVMKSVKAEVGDGATGQRISEVVKRILG